MISVSPEYPPLIELSNAEYKIGQRLVLSGVNLSANERRIGVVGRNGSGKSTLARLLCGLIEPTAGTVRIGGVDLAKDRRAALNTVGMLFQNPDHQIIFPTVEEEISFGLKQQGMSKREAGAATLRALAGFGREQWAEESVATLSQGQRHLVCLIAVLVMQPKLIILDEPYAGLDIPTTLQLTRYISDIDATVVHISHDPQILADYDRVIWLDQGELALDGATVDILPAFTKRMHELGGGDALV